MRKIVLAMLLAVCLPATAGLPDWIIPGPLSIVMHVGKWVIAQDSKEPVYYIQVQATAPTESQARDEAFRLAVDQALGSLLVSETKIQNGNIDRHDVINYSSGYIHDFKYVKQHRSADGVVLLVDVWVQKSKIAERISLDNSSSGILQGGRIAQSFASISEKNQTGDKLLGAVLSDYPYKAVDIQLTDTVYTVEDRKPMLNLTFSVWWKQSWISALKESLNNVGKKIKASSGDNPAGVTFRNKVQCSAAGWFCNDTHYITDSHKSRSVVNHLLTNKPAVLVTIVDVHNHPVYKQCWQWDNMQGQGYPWRTNNLFTNGIFYQQAVLKNNLKLDLSAYDISQMDRVTLEIATSIYCN